MLKHVETVVRNFSGQVNLWHAWGRINCGSAMPLSEDQKAEIAAARADLAARGPVRDADTSALEARIAGVEAQLAELTAAVSALAADPEALIDRAVTSAFDGLGETVADVIAGLRGTTDAQ